MSTGDETVEALLVDLLEWIGDGARPYGEVMEAWRTSCPHLPVWEEANSRGFLARTIEPGRGEVVSVSAAGRTFVDGRRRRRRAERTLVVEVEDPRRDDVRTLLGAHLAFSRSVTPPEFAFVLEVDELAEPSVTFFSARADGELLGVAALRHIDARQVEIKCMHTRQDLRRNGVAEQLVKALLAVAAERGYKRMSLETGKDEAFAPARALYRKLGFEPRAPFGDYRESPYNTFMAIAVDPADARSRHRSPTSCD